MLIWALAVRIGAGVIWFWHRKDPAFTLHHALIGLSVTGWCRCCASAVIFRTNASERWIMALLIFPYSIAILTTVGIVMSW
jgi:hypothetical protein